MKKRMILLGAVLLATSCVSIRKPGDSFTGTIVFSSAGMPGAVRSVTRLDVKNGRLVRALRTDKAAGEAERTREREKFERKDHEWLQCVFGLGLLELPDQSELPDDWLDNASVSDGGGVTISVNGTGVERSISYLHYPLHARPEDQVVSTILRVVNREIISIQ